MTQAITYTLFLEEPCLLTAPGGDPNTESSLSYIPGGALRGALAARYLRNGNDSADPTFTDLFLNGKVRYLNAYPLLGETRMLPTPRAWTKLKDQADSILDRTDATERKQADRGIPKSLGKPFARLADGALTEPETEIAVHTARNRAKGRAIEGDADSALFRYKALARSQTFVGVVVMEDDAVGLADRLTNLLGDQLLLGGSHMAGYGLVGVRVAPVTEGNASTKWREVGKPPADIPAGESLIVYLTSDAILRNPTTGGPTGDICVFLPDGPDGYTIEHSYAATGWVGGFNKQWGLPLAQQWAVLMGSTWVIKTNKSIKTKDITGVERQGIGARTEEGFGRLIIAPVNAPPWRQGAAPARAVPPAMPIPLDNTAQDILTRMNERAVRAELDRLLVKAVNEKADSKKVRGHLSRSQLGRLQVRIRREAEEDEGDLSGFVRYLEGTRERKSADDQFRKFTLGGENFRNYLRRLASNPQAIWLEFLPTVEEEVEGQEEKRKRVNWTPPQIGSKPYTYQSNELAGEYTIRFIANLCRQLAKQEGES